MILGGALALILPSANGHLSWKGAFARLARCMALFTTRCSFSSMYGSLYYSLLALLGLGPVRNSQVNDVCLYGLFRQRDADGPGLQVRQTTHHRLKSYTTHKSALYH
jgi:hypothetical protein